MRFTQTVIFFALSCAALAAPRKRASTLCGQYQSTVIGNSTVYNNLWGESSGSGSQCTTVISNNNNTIAWSTSWSWSGGSSQVKSYANVVTSTPPKQISGFKSLPTIWNWSYKGSNIVADVAYDAFTSSSPNGAHQYEIMIWLAALGGAGPISSSGAPVATTTIGGTTFKLFSGRNGSTTVYSFVAESPVYNFSADLLLFFQFLETSQHFSSSQYLLNVGAGTEPFTGSNAVLTTTAYSLRYT